MSRSLRYRPFAGPGTRTSTAPAAFAAEAATVEEIPSIDDFLDELPPIEDFLLFDAPVEVAEYSAEVEEMTEAEPLAEPEPPQEEGWARGSWQNYDWGSAAQLAKSIPEPVDSAASWNETRWPADDTAMSTSGETTPNADEIADALDGIARRLRSGELVIDNLKGTPPEAAMAAALAVLLRMQG